MPRVPQPVIIAACLCTGLGLGLAFPQNQVVLGIAQSGTWFPKTIVTFATAIIFVLMSAALAKTLLTHRRSGAISPFYVIGLYVLMGCLAALRLGVDSRADGAADEPSRAGLPGLLRLAARHRDRVHGTVFAEQPLLQVLVAAFLVGAWSALIARPSPGRARPHRRRRLDAGRLREAALVLPDHDRLPGDLHSGAVRLPRPGDLRPHDAEPGHRVGHLVSGDAAARAADHQAQLAADLEVLRDRLHGRIRHRRVVRDAAGESGVRRARSRPAAGGRARLDRARHRAQQERRDDGACCS